MIDVAWTTFLHHLFKKKLLMMQNLKQMVEIFFQVTCESSPKSSLNPGILEKKTRSCN